MTKHVLIVLLLLSGAAYSQTVVKPVQSSQSVPTISSSESARIHSSSNNLSVSASSNAISIKSTPVEEHVIDWKFFFEIVATSITTIATGVMAFFTYRLYVSTERLWMESTKASELARISAEASKRSAEAMEREFASTHRPRLRIKHVWLGEQLSTGNRVKIKIAAVNTGDLDARITLINVATCIVQKNMYPPNDPFINGNTLSYTVPLIVSGGMTLTNNEFFETDVISGEQLKQIRDQNYELYCFAYIEYINALTPPVTMKTSCCRVLLINKPPMFQQAVSGQFIKPSVPSEHEYAD